MSKFEVLTLTKEWLINVANAQSRENITKLINKAYSQVHFKFEYISSPRIKNGDLLINDLEIESSKEFILYVLLGPEDLFTKWKLSGFERDFAKTTKLDEIYACNIPEKYLEYLKIDQDDLNYTVAGQHFQFDQEILNRVITTCGFKSSKYIGNDKELTLTAFTSFMRGSASTFLDIVIKQCLFDYKKFKYFSPDDLSKINKLIIQADVIKEHQLVDYYVNKCGFKKSPKKDIYVGSPEDCPFQDEVETMKPFHISFIYREVEVQ